MSGFKFYTKENPSNWNTLYEELSHPSITFSCIGIPSNDSSLLPTGFPVGAYTYGLLISFISFRQIENHKYQSVQIYIPHLSSVDTIPSDPDALTKGKLNLYIRTFADGVTGSGEYGYVWRAYTPSSLYKNTK